MTGTFEALRAFYRRHRPILVVAALVVLGALIASSIAWPRWFVPHRWQPVRTVALDLVLIEALALVLIGRLIVRWYLGPRAWADKRRAARTLVRALAAVGAVVAVALPIWQLIVSQRSTANTLRHTELGRLDERFGAAVSQLGDDSLSVRAGAIYALERIAGNPTDPGFRGMVLDLLAAFVRERSLQVAATPEADGGAAEALAIAQCQAFPSTVASSSVVPPDMLAAMTVLQRRAPAQDAGHRLDLSGASLRGLCLPLQTDFAEATLFAADLRDAGLAAVKLEGSNLAEANLTGAHLTGAKLAHANLSGATLDDADLEGADLSGAHFLGGATLRGALLKEAILAETDFSDADLSGAVLMDATILATDFAGALMTCTDLRGTDLSLAVNLDQEQIDGSLVDSTTILPPGLVPPTDSQCSASSEAP